MAKTKKVTKKATGKRTYRPVEERLDALEAKREQLCAAHALKVQAIDARINHLRDKYADLLEMRRMMDMPADQLRHVIDAAKLAKRALKAKR